MSFTIVEFTETNGVEIVATKWLSEEEDYCFWPPFKSAKVSMLVKELADVGSKWTKHAVRVMGKAASYERARQKVKLAVMTSDINTDYEDQHTKRVRRPVKRTNASDSESSGADTEDFELMPPTVPHSLKKSASKSPAKYKINKRSSIRSSSIIPSATSVILLPSSSQRLPSSSSEMENINLSTNANGTEVSEVSRVPASQEYYSSQQTRGNLSISETPLKECFLQPCVTTTPKAPEAVSAVMVSRRSTPVPTSDSSSFRSPIPLSVSASTGDVATSCFRDDSNEANARTADSDPPPPSSVCAPVSSSASESFVYAADHLPVGVHGDVGKKHSSTEASAAVNGPESSQATRYHSQVGLVRVLTLLQEVKETQRIQGSMLQTILRQTNSIRESSQLPEDLSLPLLTVTDLQNFEERAKEPLFRAAVIGVLGDLGGRNIKETTYRAMAFMISNSLAGLCSVHGRSEKTPLFQSELMNVIFRGVKRNPRTSSCTRKEVELKVAKWLSGSRDRDGGRLLRAQREKMRKTAVPGARDME